MWKQIYLMGTIKCMKHLVVLHKEPLNDVLSGKKTIESRFTMVRCLPFGRVMGGDRLLLKQAAGPVKGVATAAKVLFFENLSPKKVRELFNKYPGIRAGPCFIKMKESSRYATLIFLEDVKRLEPYKVDKKDRRPWVVLD
ncbi:ASCH domain-containing protein [Candidatus Bathyarchaeota archaeon]|nr:ASCH domain-containing protein [Candidatus Bathyarchaeota archaeon]